MNLPDLLSNPIAVKVLYAYIAASLGMTGITAVNTISPQIMVEKVAQVERRLEKMEGLIIEMIRNK